jgi:hypothetical protein
MMVQARGRNQVRRRGQRSTTAVEVVVGQQPVYVRRIRLLCKRLVVFLLLHMTGQTCPRCIANGAPSCPSRKPVTANMRYRAGELYSYCLFGASREARLGRTTPARASCCELWQLKWLHDWRTLDLQLLGYCTVACMSACLMADH